MSHVIQQSEQNFAVPEPDLTPRELIDRAIALRPMLLERQEQTEQLGHYPLDMHEEFNRVGFYRTLQPRVFGGYEFDLPTYFKVMLEVSRGCPSSGWCLAFGHATVFQLSIFFSEAAQREIFGPDGHYIAAGRGYVGGKAVPTDDGYRVDGFWPYCSGVPFSTHVMVSTVVAKPGQTEAEAAADPARTVMAVLPRSEYEIVDDWGSILGMRGSGSNSIRVDGGHIPEHYLITHPYALLAGGDETVDAEIHQPESASLVHANPMFRAGRILPFFWGTLAASTIGTGWAALDEFQRNLDRAKTTSPPHSSRRAARDHLRVFGEALGILDSAEAILMSVGRRYLELAAAAAEGTGTFTDTDDTRLVAMAQRASNMAAQATHSLVNRSGPRFLSDSERMQRYLRDIVTCQAHPTYPVDVYATWFAKSYLGDDLAPDEITL